MRLFLLAIGGTGSRVLKSLLMLSAAGVRPVDEDGHPVPNLEIVPVIIDPHKSNEDLKRTEALLTNYRSIRNRLYGNEVNVDGFFANRIVTLREIMSDSTIQLNDTFIFNLSAVEREKFRDFIGYDTMNEANQALTSLLFADYQLENRMNIGFVGSPNIGSVALNEIKDSDEFKALANVFNAGDRIFFISSIFGGTGAAGFPIMVKNLRQASNLDINNRDVLRRAPIGGITVLPYFNIEHNDDHRIDKADFIVKTQSALYYYKETLTGSNDSELNAIFYVGDQEVSKPYAYDPGEHGQRNRAHLVELVAAMAPLKFAGIADSRLTDQNGYPMPTMAFEFGLEKDVRDVDFLAFGSSTRHLIYEPLVRFHLLFLFLRTGLRGMIGQGFTEDEPKLKSDFLTSQFYRTLTDQFMRGYVEWLSEMYDNNRSVQLFNMGENDMSNAIHHVHTRKSLLGRKTVDNNTFKAEMNRLSRDAKYSTRTAEYKLLDLFNRAATTIVRDRYENIN
ncbi:MAG: hypothetical protein J6I72_07165 [Muribaculaceae bacterium]|nr:hypothetical protein [Muribaculaceae bacterium]